MKPDIILQKPNALPYTIRGLAIRWIGPPARARENRLLALAPAPRTVSVGDFIYIPCSLTSTVVASALPQGFLWAPSGEFSSPVRLA
ncbi:hypothetical protein N7509_003260 [Penicillium cosmopolitanum]|uniref:Uncharacterized protein n=1 Tax=Penicillium cosmopolitanum TaxID=1131564 RepID=A0A9W9W4K8_9EURO|nr:uncharacterized protein N7509_003260 [Penicillium cosmopolitanum]KAJ5403389.1 hypothetical protein N7509_003260 [Penicillium cosmopolitanum]